MNRGISLPTHAAVELALGVAVLAGPVAVGAGPAGIVAGVSLGVLMVGLALAGSESLPLSAHQAFDRALVAALVGGGLGLAVAGELAAGVLLALAGGLQLVLLAATHWTRA